MHDELGDRIKNNYESRTIYYLPRRTYTIIRVDGKAFHSYTCGCEKPFDYNLMACMDATALGLCKQIEGTVFAYSQSDEISLLVTDFAKINTEAWFDGNIQKICSVSASIATAEFNKVQIENKWKKQSIGLEEILKFAHFDSRVFSIPDPVEVANYFVWRSNDAIRNSISSAARAIFFS